MLRSCCSPCRCSDSDAPKNLKLKNASGEIGAVSSHSHRTYPVPTVAGLRLYYVCLVQVVLRVLTRSGPSRAYRGGGEEVVGGGGLAGGGGADCGGLGAGAGKEQRMSGHGPKHVHLTRADVCMYVYIYVCMYIYIYIYIYIFAIMIAMMNQLGVILVHSFFDIIARASKFKVLSIGNWTTAGRTRRTDPPCAA
jgi:hypothetical protein